MAVTLCYGIGTRTIEFIINSGILGYYEICRITVGSRGYVIKDKDEKIVYIPMQDVLIKLSLSTR